MKTTPAIEAARQAHAAAGAKLEEARQEESEAEEHLVATIAAELGLEADDLRLGPHDCEESPIGRCIYNEEMDPACDACLFCDLPRVRK